MQESKDAYLKKLAEYSFDELLDELEKKVSDKCQGYYSFDNKLFDSATNDLQDIKAELRWRGGR